MAQSFANVRLGAAALFLAAGMAVSACGGDDGGDDKEDVNTDDSGTPDVKKDGGGGGADGGSPATDGGTRDAAPTVDSDASTAELAAAFASSGVDITSRRADLVFRAACQKADDCDLLSMLSDATTVDGCTTESRASYQSGVTDNFSETCLDAVLDVNGCLARATDCTTLDDFCASELEARGVACDPFVNDDDDGGVVDEGDAGT